MSDYRVRLGTQTVYEVIDNATEEVVLTTTDSHEAQVRAGLAPRTAAYAQDGITDPDTGRHMVAYVTEGEAGYHATTYTGTLEYCEQVAASINETKGLSREDVLGIVASSFAAHNRA